MSYKKHLKHKAGFTLIEVIVAMAIIAILSTAVLSVFLNSHVGIINAGKKSAADYSAQDQMEKIMESSLNGPSMSSTYTIQLSFPSAGLNNKPVTGRKIDVSYPYSSGTKTLTAFTIDP